jgi:hypothetical protein
VTPEEALAAARARAQQRRGAGEQAVGGFTVRPVDGPSATDLAEWALVEPDLAGLRSTRPYGAPITLFKRGLYRALGQYFRALIAEQTRFNLQVALYVAELERRVREFEERPG